MKIKVIIFLILGTINVAGLCFAQSREPSLGSESSSRGTTSVSSDSSSGIDSSVGYDSGNHGNVS